MIFDFLQNRNKYAFSDEFSMYENVTDTKQNGCFFFQVPFSKNTNL